MNEDTEKRSDQEQAAESALRGLAAPSADPALRARLRQEFATGTIRPRLTLVPARPARRGLGPFLSGLAAAAAVLILVATWANQGPRWSVHRIEGSGTVTVDGRNFPAGQAAEISAALHPGAVVHLSQDMTLDLNAGSTLVLELAEQAHVELPGVPGKWWSREVHGQVMAGDLRICTGRAFHGARLMVKGRDADAIVTGTTLTVLCDEDGTCVCVREGTVQVGRPNAPMVAVPQGQLLYTPHDGTASVCHGMRPEETVALDALLARERSPLGR